ncbi:DUF3168 domain-containing protein [Erythrobacteraceae bacterium CFH 75059]|uniref:DUF3168 domain-containing protein n=1 Tax=Qipengyuania thermophila TaxID=2509361 RepID=UPI00101FF493|nr:DUF3168 domain-containing protein [Qipengyuania thermophila]TCD06847.1 DUF3168 domain-containing protein [Erythrobacteraceae bacterium CFH 75059]
MESALRRALVDWLRADPVLGAGVNAIGEETGPAATPPPVLALAASAASDWSVKERSGREVRVALELLVRGDATDEADRLAARVEQRIAAMAPEQDGFQLVATGFLRSRTERRPRNLRAVLLEYRFLLLAAA